MDDQTILELISKFIITTAILIAIIAIKGDWILLLLYINKQFEGATNSSKSSSVDESIPDLNTFLSPLRLQNLSTYWFPTIVSSFLFYFSVAFYFHWNYYVRKKDKAQEWKCQPKRWMPAELEWKEIKAGCLALFIVNTWTSIISCHIANGGYTTLYYQWDEYGVLWFFAQFPCFFIYQDYATYWMHRMLHMPYFYTRFHRRHHIYMQPTVFCATAIHPIEVTFIQTISSIPIFLIPMHYIPIQVVAINAFYHGMVTHSGVNVKAPKWQPWQPDAVFHDNHHQYFHVNFGMNCVLWDRIHGTYRRTDRVYSENIFYGKGVPLAELREDDLEEERRERETETIVGYSNCSNPYVLS